MSIVNSVQQFDGRHMVERHYDHLGNEYTQTWFVPSGWTQAQIDARTAANAAKLAASLAEGEAQQVLG